MTTNDILALMAWMAPYQLPLPVVAADLEQADMQQLLWGLPVPLWAPPPALHAVWTFGATQRTFLFLVTPMPYLFPARFRVFTFLAMPRIFVFVATPLRVFPAKGRSFTFLATQRGT